MASVLVQTAEAVKDALNTANGSSTFSVDIGTVERSYADWDMELEEAETLRVDVVPVGYAEQTGQDARDNFSYFPQVDIGIRKRFTTSEQDHEGRPRVADVDEFIALVDEFAESLAPGVLADYAAAQWESTEIRAAYVRQHLREMRQLTSIIRVTFHADTTI